MIWFTRCPGSYKMKHQDIEFKTRRAQAIESKEQNNSEIGKEPDTTNPEDLTEDIQLFTYLFIIIRSLKNYQNDKNGITK